MTCAWQPATLAFGTKYMGSIWMQWPLNHLGQVEKTGTGKVA